ncbi:hypothetical protein XI25_22195 [Paenibacillus sp. DMB20]|nr:hypothetical protein XI25_22195 [Paenibacillus sp. DMB20]
MIILQVTGFKNCGKTTVIEKWTRLLQARQLQVAVIKHHGHGGPLSMPSPETDSMRLLAAGAVNSMAVGDGMVQMHMRGEPALEELVMLAGLAKPDVVLIEGYKDATYPKAVLVRTKEEWLRLRHSSNIRLVLAYEDAGADFGEEMTVLDVGDDDRINQWMLDYIEGDR